MELLKNAAEIIDDFIFILDENSNIVFANKYAKDKLGYTLEEIKNINAIQLHPKQFRNEAKVILKDMLDEKSKFCRLPLVNKNGEIIPVETKVKHIIFEEKKYIFGISKDLSEQNFSNEKFKKSFENNPSPMAISKMDTGEIISINGAYAEMFKYSEHELIGRKSTEIGILTQKTREHLLNVLKNNGVIKSEYVEVKTKNGEILDGFFSAEIIETKDGKILLTSFLDNSEKNRMKKDIQIHEEKWKFAVEGSGLGVWGWNMETNKVFFSKIWKEILGYEEYEIPNNIDEFKKRVHIDDYERVSNDFNKYILGEDKYYKNQHRVLCKNGEYKWILDRGIIIERDSNGKPVRMTGIRMDINEQIENTIKLRKSEERFRMLFENMTSSFLLNEVIVNEKNEPVDFKIILANSAYEKHYGQNTKDIIGKTIKEINPNADNEMIRKYCDVAVTGIPFKIEYYSETYKKYVSCTAFSPSKGEFATISEDITDRKQKESELNRIVEELEKTTKELRVSQEIYAQFLKHSPVYVFFKTNDIRVISVSHNFEKLLGIPIEKIIGKTMDELFPSEMAKKMIEDDKKVLREEKIVQVEEEFNGRIYSTIKFPVYIEEKPVFLAGFTIDITEQKKAQIELIESENRFKGLFNSVNDGIWLHNKEMKILMVNDKICEILGYSKEELLEMNISDINTKRSAKFISERFENLRKYGKAVFETEHMTKNKQKLLMELSVSLLNNREELILASIRDISERKRIEIALRESEARFRNIFENHSAAMMLIDLKSGRIIDANKAAIKFYGYSKKELKSIWIWNINVKSKEEYLSKIKEAKIKNINYFEFTHRLANGEFRAVEVHTSQIKIKKESILFSIIHDISEKKKVETELLKAKEEADKAALSKSQFLANMSHEIRTPLNGIIGILQILKATKIDKEQINHLNAMEKASENLMYVINEILDYSKLEAGGYKKKNDRYEIRESFVKLQNLFEVSIKNDVNIFFFVSKYIPEILEADKIKIENILINLIGNAIKFTNKGEITVSAIVLEETNDIYKLKIVVEDTGKGIPKEKIKELFSSFMQVDESASRQYEGTGLGLSIAKGYAKVIGGDIFVESMLGKGSKFWLEFECKKIREHLEAKSIFDVGIIFFHPGKIIELTSKIISEYSVETFIVFEYEELIIALECCEKEGKRVCIFVEDSIIKVDSEEVQKLFSKYITFVIGDFSVLKEGNLISRRNYTQNVIEKILQGKAYEEIELMESGNVDKLSFKNNIRAMVVEDNALNTYVLEKMINLIGIECVYFDKAMEAVDFFKKERIDIVLTDIQLPEVSGFELIGIIRELEKNCEKKTPIIAITAHSTVGYKEKCITAGVDDYLVKPIKIEDLIDIFLKYFEMNKTKRSEILQKIEEFKRNNEIDIKTFPILFELYDESIIELKKAVKENDNNTIIYIAHNMKGSFRVAELNEIADLYEQIEYKVANIEEEIKKIELLVDSIRRRMEGDTIESIDC